MATHSPRADVNHNIDGGALIIVLLCLVVVFLFLHYHKD